MISSLGKALPGPTPELEDWFGMHGEEYPGIMFDGGSGGKHELHITRNVDGENPNLGNLRLTTSQDGVNWTRDTSYLGFQLVHGLAATGRNDFWYSHPDTKDVVRTDKLDQAPKFFDLAESHSRPTVAKSPNGWTYVTYAGNDGRIHFHWSHENGAWQYQRNSASTGFPPGLTIVQGRVVCFHYGGDDRLHYASWNTGSTPSNSWAHVENLPAAPGIPAIVGDESSKEVVLWIRDEDLTLRVTVIEIVDIENKRTSFDSRLLSGFEAASELSAFRFKGEHFCLYRNKDRFLEKLSKDGEIQKIPYFFCIGDPIAVPIDDNEIDIYFAQGW